MVKVIREEKIEMSIKTLRKILRQADSGSIRIRCNDCSLEWEPSHFVEACPLRELEWTFLSEAWFLVPGEETSAAGQMF